MAILKNKGITLIEVSISLLVFIIGIGIFASSYINLVKQNLINQKYQASIGNLKLGLEKIWREMKYGVDFDFDSINKKISFNKVYDCKKVAIYRDNEKLIYELDSASSSLTDPNVIRIENLNIEISTSSLPDQATPTVMLVTLALSGKSKVGFQEIPINFQISVAPINSVFPDITCLQQ